MKSATKNFKKVARRCVNEAKKLAPFEAEYNIDGLSVSYLRLQGEDRKHVWTRKLKGVAVHHSLVTLFFKKWTSLSPIMVILHEDFDLLKPALEQQDIEFKSFSINDCD